jgi:3',5'-cyclic AMP phosphodiesterase CpdA
MLLASGCEEQALKPVSTETQWRFIVTGDSRSEGENNGVNVKILGELAEEIAKQNVDFVLVPGDLVNGGVSQRRMEIQFSTWLKTMKPVYDAGIGVYPVRGNHDKGEPEDVAAWNKFFDYLPDNGPPGEKNLTYSFKHNNALIIGVDQYIKESRVNQTWLDEQLAANASGHVFIFGHEPAFKADHEDCLDDYPDARDRFCSSIEKAGARAYFCGHDHFYNHATADDNNDPTDDVHQYIVGTAGAPLYRWSPPYDGDNGPYTVQNVHYARKHGYVLVEIDGPVATLTWMQRTAPGRYQSKDTFTYTTVSRRRK